MSTKKTTPAAATKTAKKPVAKPAQKKSSTASDKLPDLPRELIAELIACDIVIIPRNTEGVVRISVTGVDKDGKLVYEGNATAGLQNGPVHGIIRAVQQGLQETSVRARVVSTKCTKDCSEGKTKTKANGNSKSKPATKARR